MANGDFDRLAALIEKEQSALLAHWREQVRRLPSAKHLDTPTLNDHIPLLLVELATAFRLVSDETIPEALLESSPPIHGLQRYQEGFDIVEIVAEYNILRGCIHDLAETNRLNLQGRPFHILNRVFDEAIGSAVQTFADRQALEVQQRREEYLALVAHDLRTPLNAISLAARVLEFKFKGAAEDRETTRLMKTLHRNVQSLESLVASVLKENAHVETESGVKLERREFDLWPMVEALVHDLHPLAATTGARLINNVPDEIVVFADASSIQRVLQNLVANAVKYAPRGEIVVGARETGSNGGVECWVRDDGTGIPEDRIGVIFDKLETDPERTDGIGLGLTVVKTFIEAHGGTVTVDSKEGVGSTFRFTLPGRSKLVPA